METQEQHKDIKTKPWVEYFYAFIDPQDGDVKPHMSNFRWQNLDEAIANRSFVMRSLPEPLHEITTYLVKGTTTYEVLDIPK